MARKKKEPVEAISDDEFRPDDAGLADAFGVLADPVVAEAPKAEPPKLKAPKVKKPKPVSKTARKKRKYF